MIPAFPWALVAGMASKLCEWTHSPGAMGRVARPRPGHSDAQCHPARGSAGPPYGLSESPAGYERSAIPPKFGFAAPGSGARCRLCRSGEVEAQDGGEVRHAGYVGVSASGEREVASWTRTAISYNWRVPVRRTNDHCIASYSPLFDRTTDHSMSTDAPMSSPLAPPDNLGNGLEQRALAHSERARRQIKLVDAYRWGFSVATFVIGVWLAFALLDHWIVPIAAWGRWVASACSGGGCWAGLVQGIVAARTAINPLFAATWSKMLTQA